MIGMTDILPLLLLVLLLYGVKLPKPLRAFRTEDYLSMDTGRCQRGFFALVVVFHHLAQRTESGAIFHFFTNVGYLAVSVFFFLSGYGLQRSYISKGESYRKTFLRKRLSSILIPYVIITAFFWLVNCIDGRVYSLGDIFNAIIDGRPIASHSWYIINILIFYLFYWLFMAICREKYLLMILCGTVWYALYVFFCVKLSYGEWWYNTSFLPVIGMLWATYEPRILDFLKKTYIFVAPMTWAAFITLFVFKLRITAQGIAASISMSLITGILFALSVVLLSLKVQIGNKALHFLGRISLDLYLSQGLFIELFRSHVIYIENEMLWCVTVLGCTILFGWGLHWVLQRSLYRWAKVVTPSTPDRNPR